jgi:hypothetical protein
VSKISSIYTAHLNYGPQSTMKDIRGKWKMRHGQTYRMQIYTTIREKSIIWTRTFWGTVSKLRPPNSVGKRSKHPSFSFHAGTAEERLLGTLLTSTTSDWVCLQWYPTQHCSRAITRWRSVDLDSFMHHVRHCSAFFLAVQKSYVHTAVFSCIVM